MWQLQSGDSPQEVLYKAPSVMPPSPAITLFASSVFDPTRSGSATVQLTRGTVLLVPNKLAINLGHYEYEHKNKCNDGMGKARLTNFGSTSLTISGFTLQGADSGAFS
jgi:hypothetical protein